MMSTVVELNSLRVLPSLPAGSVRVSAFGYVFLFVCLYARVTQKNITPIYFIITQEVLYMWLDHL